MGRSFQFFFFFSESDFSGYKSSIRCKKKKNKKNKDQVFQENPTTQIASV